VGRLRGRWSQLVAPLETKKQNGAPGRNRASWAREVSRATYVVASNRQIESRQRRSAPHAQRAVCGGRFLIYEAFARPSRRSSCPSKQLEAPRECSLDRYRATAGVS